MDKSIYNASIIGKILVTPDLMILRIKTDSPRETFKSGQYATLGLLSNEDRSINSLPENIPAQSDILIERHYSIASAENSSREFEFYISQVKTGQLTPRLFNLTLGDRLWISEKITGIFSLSDIPPNNDILMIATGTGLAPYISFLRSHLTNRPNSKLAIIHGAGYLWDLGYYSELKLLSNIFPNFIYEPTVLRADSTWDGYSCKIEDILLDEDFLNRSQIALDPCKTHVFLCGNPKMVEKISSILLPLGYSIKTYCQDGALHIEES